MIRKVTFLKKCLKKNVLSDEGNANNGDVSH